MPENEFKTMLEKNGIRFTTNEDGMFITNKITLKELAYLWNTAVDKSILKVINSYACIEKPTIESYKKQIEECKISA